MLFSHHELPTACLTEVKIGFELSVKSHAPHHEARRKSFGTWTQPACKTQNPLESRGKRGELLHREL